MDLMSLTAVELGKKIASGEVTSVEATKVALDRMEQLEKEYNSFVTINKYIS